MTPSFRPTSRPRLGEVLVQLGFLRADALAQTLAEPGAHDRPMGALLLGRGLCSEPQLMEGLARQTGLGWVDLNDRALRCTRMLPEAVARRHRAVVVERGPDCLAVLAAPAPIDAQDAVRAILGKSRVRFALASDAAIDGALARLYAPEAAPAAPVPAMPEPTGDILARLDLSARTVDVVRAAAAELSITPREVVRRAMESWASTRRARG